MAAPLGAAATALRSAATSRVVALVTGANRGLGFELSRQLLRLGGYHIIASARKWEGGIGSARAALQAAADEAGKTPTRRLGGVDFLELDVASDASRYEVQGRLAALLGAEARLNVLVNNAAVYLPDWSEAALALSLATNTIGPLRLATELAPFFAAGDAHVINVSTGLSHKKYASPDYLAAISGCRTIDDLAARVVFRADDAKMRDEVVRLSPPVSLALERYTPVSRLAPHLPRSLRRARPPTASPRWR